MPNRQAKIEITAVGPEMIIFGLAEAPVGYGAMGRFAPLELDRRALPPLDSPANVQAYGATLTGALCSHQAVGAELQQIFGTMPPDQACLQFEIGVPEAEALRWETLCDAASAPGRFLALHGICSMKRIATGGGTRDPGLRTFSGPIRMSAFLSAVGATAREEFRVIAQAVAAARATGLEVEARVYLGEEDLLQDPGDPFPGGAVPPGVEVRPIPPSALALQQQLRGDQPHLLHFFCHGHAEQGPEEAGVQRVELASISDHDAHSLTGRPGSVHLSIERLVEELAAEDTVWLTVLNSCSGGRPVQRLHSMAAALAKAASPVAIGMAEPIRDSDATRFAEVFYREAFELIRQATMELKEGETSTIDLAPAVGHARVELHHSYKNDGPPGWCLPILYQHAGPLKVARLDPLMGKRVKLVAEALRSQPMTTPIEIRLQLLEVLDKAPAVPAAVRPDRYGNFA